MENGYIFAKQLIASKMKNTDMTRYYDGFKIQSKATLQTYNFHYIKGIPSTDVENMAIAKIMQRTGETRANLWISGFIAKGNYFHAS